MPQAVAKMSVYEFFEACGSSFPQILALLPDAKCFSEGGHVSQLRFEAIIQRPVASSEQIFDAVTRLVQILKSLSSTSSTR